MTAINLNRFRSLDIPKDYLVIKTSTQYQILSGGMPFNIVDTSLMSMQIDFPLIRIRFQAFIGYVPNLDGPVVGARGDFVVIEWIKFQINDWSTMTSYTWMINIDATSLDQILVRRARLREIKH
jgi:hypothetical protein